MILGHFYCLIDISRNEEPMKQIPFKHILLVASVLVGHSLSAIEREVRIQSHRGDFELAGTLAFPPDGNAKAVIVTATGSGLQDRDETVFGHRPFKVISDALVENGYAVLRMDDRGFGESGGDGKSASLSDFADDVESGLRYVETFFQSPKGVLGHSLGGAIAPILASEGKADFIITLGGPAWQGDSIVMSQARKLAVDATGKWEGEQRQRELLAVVKERMPDFIARPILFEILSRDLGQGAAIPEVRHQLNVAIDGLLSPSYREILRFDPADVIKKTDVPWLALYGEKDIQVLPGNLQTLKELNKDIDTYLLQKHNHLFQDNSTGSLQEYETLGQAPSEECIRIIVDWLEKKFNN